MQKMKIVLAGLMVLQLAACGGSGDTDGTGPGIPPVTEPDTTPQVYLEEDFNAGAALPEGWQPLAGNEGTVAVRGGSLYIDGRAHSTRMTAVNLPVSLQGRANYRIEVDFTIEAAVNNKRWAAIVYRNAATPTMEPYHQMAVRQNAADAVGTEFALRQGGEWSVISARSFREAIEPTRTYRATIEVHGQRARQYLDGVLLHDVELDSALAQGGIALQTAGALMRVDKVRVTEQRDALPPIHIFSPQDSGTLASMAPTLVQVMDARTALAGSGASNALFHVDSALQLRSAGGESLGSLQQYLGRQPVPAIPVLRINDQATVEALAAFVVRNGYNDITLLSADVTLLATARRAMPGVRAAVDFSARTGLTGSTEDLLSIVRDTNRAGAKIAVLPSSLATRDNVARLQQLLVTVWASADAAAPAAVAQVLTTGVDGVVTPHAAAHAQVLRKLPAHALLRKPLVIGHRGMPSRVDENTLESALTAAEAGADVIENDIYMTTDQHLVIMHDSTVNRTTTGTGKIETMSLADVRALKTKSGHPVPTLDEYFTAFKGKRQVHFVEIKSARPEIVDLLRQAVDRHGVRDQLAVISFNTHQLERMREVMPEVSVGMLNSLAMSADKVTGGVKGMLDLTQSYSSTFNPDYSKGLNPAVMEAAKHRGITIWPWTLRKEDDFYRFYSYGTHGLTTDDAHWAQNFPVAMAAAPGGTVALQQPAAVPLQLTTQGGAQLQALSTQLVVLEGTAQYSAQPDGSIHFTTPGTATVLPGYTHRMGESAHSYTLIGAPVTLTVK